LKIKLNNLLNASQKKILYFLLPSLSVIFISIGLTAAIWIALSPNEINHPKPDEISHRTSLFAKNYPANGKFQKELVALKHSGALQEFDELEIQKALLVSSEYLAIPPALLWCLLFQESRLNHLEGIDSEKSTLGLGQFSRFGFQEINHESKYFTASNIKLLHRMFGRDIRPIEAKKKDLLSPSSYFSIPTAVTTSAIYLNNRYEQLSKLLDKRSIPYNPDILWLFSAMAYNKGTRSILSLWNSVYRKKGQSQFTLLVNDFETFKKTIGDSPLLTKSLKRIWEDRTARAYSQELKSHSHNITSCAVSPLLQTTRSLTEVEP